MTCDVCGHAEERLVLIQDQHGRITICLDCVRAMPPFLRVDIGRPEPPSQNRPNRRAKPGSS